MTTRADGLGTRAPSGPQNWDNGGSGTGRCANTDPLLDRINLEMEGSGPVAIMPEVQSTVTTPPNLEIERMARADGCPQACGNLETPYRVEDAPHGFTAYYECGHCGHRWFTGWGER